MIKFDGKEYDESTFPPHALYHLHRLFEVKRALEMATERLNNAIRDTSVAQVTIEGLMDLETRSNDVIRRELEALEPVPANGVSGT
jgi:hypothetical protein